MDRGVELFSYKERLRKLDFFTVERGRLQGDLIVSFQYLNRTYKEEDQLFTQSDSDKKE